MSAADGEILLRPMLPADVPVLCAIYQASIDELAAEDYDEQQRDAWAAAAEDEATFGARLQAALTLVATIRNAPVGFIALENRDAITMLYVYPAAARRGVATHLLQAIEKLAGNRGIGQLAVDSSDTARPFFEAAGFVAEVRQTVTMGSVWFGNTRMQKRLPAP